ncbi:MAG: AMP-binding protein [Streptosporangiales bacterium]|nr:AMP-binding protein [Streptosporangiales bacterium]
MGIEQEYLDDLAERQRRAWPEGVPREVVYPLGERPVTECLRERARTEPDRTLLIFYGTEFSYGQADELSDRFAAYLMAQGVAAGERVAVMLPNCPQFMIAFYGILKAGCVHVPVNPMFQAEELRYELRDCGATTVLVADGLAALVESVRDGHAVRRLITTRPGAYLPAEPAFPVPRALTAPAAEPPAGAVAWEEALDTALPEAWPEADLDRLAALNYTGGTTGMPKGCEHTQRHMLYTNACSASVAGRGSGVSLVFIPVFWIAGENAGLILPVVAGSTVVLLTRWDADAVLTAVDQYGITAMSGTVDNYDELMEHPRLSEHDLTSLRGSATMSFVRRLTPERRARWKEITGGAVLREGAWGMTETHTSDTFTAGFQDGDRDLSDRPVFCGLPMPGTRFTVVDFATGDPLPIGAEGEICVRSPSLLTGYWNAPDATAQAIRDGWLHTGDIGAVDEDGCLHFLGRGKEMLKVNGMSVFPSEVEVLLGRHPDVAGSGVIGRPDAARGEVPVAYVRLRDGAAADAAGLAEWCRTAMAPYKVPEIRIVDELPLTATGKVRKHLLPRD